MRPNHHAEMRMCIDEPREHDLASGVDDEIAVRHGIIACIAQRRRCRGPPTTTRPSSMTRSARSIVRTSPCSIAMRVTGSDRALRP